MYIAFNHILNLCLVETVKTFWEALYVSVSGSAIHIKFIKCNFTLSTSHSFLIESLSISVFIDCLFNYHHTV